MSNFAPQNEKSTMATQEEYAQMKAYSRIIFVNDGSRDHSWDVICDLKSKNPEVKGIKFRRKVLGNKMSYRRALGYAIMMLLYATLILAGVQLVYFQFLDHGYFIENYASILKAPEMMEAAVSYGLSEQDIDSTIAVLSEMRPVEVVIQFLSSNVLLSVLLSIPMALFAKKS